MIKLGRIKKRESKRLQFLFIVMFILLVSILIRLFYLQIIDKDLYLSKAKSQHKMSGMIEAKRGNIWFDSLEQNIKYPFATSKTYLQLYAIPKDIKDASSTSQILANLLNMDREILYNRLSKENDIYEPVKSKLTDEELVKVRELNLEGLKFAEENYRFYPENEFGGQIAGFVSYKDNLQEGLYGLEGFWDNRLRGEGASFYGEKDAYGNFITIADKSENRVRDGADLYITIDQAIQHFSCEELQNGVKEYGATSGSVVVVNPQNGDVLAMCNYPSFDPNNYSKIENQSIYNNNSIFTAYEPGSVFKPITMAMGIDLGLVEPETTYTDTGSLFVDGYTIENSDHKSNGVQTMTNVLEKSLNTGAAYVGEKVGKDRFLDYARKFGFGRKTGIELDKEVEGNLKNLTKKGRIYLVTSSFGQGITATPVQLAMAFSSFANGGYLYKPRIVKKIVYSDGKQDTIEPKVVRQVISEQTANKIKAMLISVIENGQTQSAKSAHYYVGGKTGTAQATDYGSKGYIEGKTNHTFISFGPSRDPRFVIVVKYESPQRAWAESTSARLSAKIAEFIFDYYKISPER